MVLLARYSRKECYMDSISVAIQTTRKFEELLNEEFKELLIRGYKFRTEEDRGLYEREVELVVSNVEEFILDQLSGLESVLDESEKPEEEIVWEM